FPTPNSTSDGGYRVSSADLNRDLEEDLSFHPEGIKDFGVHDMGDPRGGKRTPIDIVQEHLHKDFTEAVRWLAGQLGLDPNDYLPRRDTGVLHEQITLQGSPPTTVRATILINKGEIGRMVDAAEAALLAVADTAPIMVRAGMLVQPIIDRLPASHGRMTEVALLRRLTAANLIYLLNKHAAIFWQNDRRRKKRVVVDTPPGGAHHVVGKGGGEVRTS